MALPHFKNIRTANTLREPVFQNLFEVVVDMPAVIRTTGSQRILLENATSFTKLDFITPTLGTQEQRFKYSTRAYLLTPNAEDTAPKFNIKFNINQNDKKSVEVWALMKRWYDLVWNSQTGELHYKADLVGQITVHIHDRTGEVIRRIDMINAQITGIDGFSNWDWKNNSIMKDIDVSFECDYFVDTYFDAQ
jgi:hypothetical protein